MHLITCTLLIVGQPTIDISTSLVKYFRPVQGAVLGYSSLTNKLWILGGITTNLAVSTNIVNDSVLYDESVDTERIDIQSEGSTETILSPVLSASRWSCFTQCAAQIDNLLYIVSPSLWTLLASLISPQSTNMVIFDLDNGLYVDDNLYESNVPNANRPANLDQSICVVTNGINLFVFATIRGDEPEVASVNPDPCPIQEPLCPFTELYSYNPSMNIWSSRGELGQPSIQRYQVGCAVSPDNQYIYIFGGAKVIDPISYNGDQTAKQTEKYDILNNEWNTLPSNADLDESRFGLFSFVSLTDNLIYLYGGKKYNPVPIQPQQLLDASNMKVFDITTETFLDLNDAEPRWNAGHSDFGLSNTLRITDLCQNEIGISVGSFDFNTSQDIDDIQILRFGEIYDYYNTDNEIIIEDFTEYNGDIVDIEDAIFDPYRENVFNFTITVTNGYNFIPDEDPNNYDINLTNWEGQTFNIQQLNDRYTGGGNGQTDIVSISIESEDVNLFNKCNGINNIIARINIGIVIRRIRAGTRRIARLCAQNSRRRLSRWFFKDSNSGTNIPGATDAKIQLQIFEFSFSFLFCLFFFCF